MEMNKVIALGMTGIALAVSSVGVNGKKVAKKPQGVYIYESSNKIRNSNLSKKQKAVIRYKRALAKVLRDISDITNLCSDIEAYESDMKANATTIDIYKFAEEINLDYWGKRLCPEDWGEGYEDENSDTPLDINFLEKVKQAANNKIMGLNMKANELSSKATLSDLNLGI